MEVNWVSIYQAALIELEQAKMSGRITEGQKAIVCRIETLSNVPGILPEEKNAIKSALHSLRALEEAEAEVVRRAVTNALDDLRFVRRQ